MIDPKSEIRVKHERKRVQVVDWTPFSQVMRLLESPYQTVSQASTMQNQQTHKESKVNPETANNSKSQALQQNQTQ